MNGDTTTKQRKPRPEIQIYRPGMLRNAASTKSLANDEKPPRPERDPTTPTACSSGMSVRRRSNDAESVTSRGGSGSTTPDANAINERAGKSRFDGRSYNQHDRRDGGGSSYNSTQSLYDTRRQGGYTEYNGNRSNRGPPRHQQPPNAYHHNPNPRRENFNRNFNERASMRGDGAIAKRPNGGGGRRRNDSINSTQSEMPTSSGAQLHIDTSYDSVSVNSMNSLNSTFSFEEMCQNLQNFASMDWSQEVENEFAAQKEREEEEKRVQEATPNREGLQEANRNSNSNSNSNSTSPRKNNKNRRNRRNQRDESDRESSFGGSIAEENEEIDEELKSGERTPTSVASSAYNPRAIYQRIQKNPRNSQENEFGTRRKEKTERKYRGEHDDREDSQYEGVEHHMSSGRLAGRISIVPRDERVNRSAQSKADELTKAIQKRSPEMVPREVQNRRRKEEIDRNEGLEIRQISEKIEKLAGLVKKRDVQAAEKMIKLSLELSNIYQQIILPDVIYSFTVGLEQKLFRQAFYKSIEALRSGANSTDPDSKRIRAVLQKLLLNGIIFYETLIKHYETEFHVALDDVLVWPSGAPTEHELIESMITLPAGIQKCESSMQKTAVKSLSRNLISLGDLHRYKSLIDGSENYEVSKSYYQKSAQLWPSTGHPYNQLGVVVYYSMLYRSARRARLIPVEVLSAQRQKRVIDEFFYLCRALACSHPYEAAKDRLTQRLDAMRQKIGKYQPVLDKECGKMRNDAATLKRKMNAVKQIWIHPVTLKVENSDGDRMVDDILSSFKEQSKAKLHRRAVSYLCDVFGIVLSKIGMEHLQSVSERAFGMLFASLEKAETDFTADQLVKIATMFIYAVHVNYGKNEKVQLQIAANTLTTYFSILVSIFLASREKLLLLPAIHVTATWICHPETRQILEKLEHLEVLESTILTELTAKRTIHTILEQVEAKDEQKGAESEHAYPETVLLASFFKVFDATPSGATWSSDVCSGRVQAMRRAAEVVKDLVEREKEPERRVEKDLEEPKSRQQIIEEERGKETVTVYIHPESLIPDTNVFIGELQLVKDLLESKQFQILVPTTVLDELSHISSCSASSSSTTQPREEHDPERREKAKEAMGWLREQSRLKTHGLHTLTTTGKRLASLVMASEEVTKEANTNNDDQILKSALSWTSSLPAPGSSSPLHTVSAQFPDEKFELKTCVLLTGDRGLTIKAVGSHLPCRNIEHFVSWNGKQP